MHTTPTTIPIPEQVRAYVSSSRPSCWCGQDLEHVHRSHCPRCGRAASRWAGL